MSECKRHNEHIVMVQQMMCEDCGVTELDEANDRIAELEAQLDRITGDPTDAVLLAGYEALSETSNLEWGQEMDSYDRVALMWMKMRDAALQEKDDEEEL